MKSLVASLLALSLATGSTEALDCTSRAFSALLPSNAKVVSTVKLGLNSTFQVPASDIAYPVSPTQLQPLCAVEISVVSSNCSNFTFGLFLPDRWNNRFIAVGNGAFAGGINWLDMGSAVRYGFASMSTNTGHDSIAVDLTWAFNQPQRQIDWGYRAMHGSVVLAKQLTKAYYKTAPKYSYYSGCSTGGRQGLKDLQLYPDDFDGVLAGAPAWWASHLSPWTLKTSLYNLPPEKPGRIDPSLFPAIEKEISRQCDIQDGLKDGIISDPRGCNVSLDAFLCPSNTASSGTLTCLTVPQIETLTLIYKDYIETNQTFVFPHLEPGSEAQWNVVLGQTRPLSFGPDYIKYFVLNDSNWDYNDFDYRIVQESERVDGGDATADDFDITPFTSRGGKLLMYHGLADGLIPPGSSQIFHNKVLRTLALKGKPNVDDSFRLFLIPGMQHCAYTSALQSAPWYVAGANQAGALREPAVFSVPGHEWDPKYDALVALMQWTETGRAPDRLVATKFVNDSVAAGVQRQRPLCVYPKQAKFTGRGDPNKPKNWRCEDIGAKARKQGPGGY